MKNLIPLALTFLIQISLLPVSQCRPVYVPNDATLIDQTCQKTPDHNPCVSSLRADPRSSSADVKGLGIIMVDVVKGKATDTLNQINDLLKQRPGDKSLSSCADVYNTVITADVPEASQGFSLGNPKFAEQGMNDAAGEAVSCENDEGNDLIQTTCKKTPHYDLCLSTLQSNPDSSNADVPGLARIVSDALLENESDTLDYIHGLLKQSPEADLQKALANCAELYIPVVMFSLPQAIEALGNGHFGFAKYGISDAAKEAEACEKGFGGVKSPLTDRNALVDDLSGVAVAILNLLKG